MIKKYTIAVLLSLLVPAVLFSSSGKTPRFKIAQEAELTGKLGFGAMTADAHNELIENQFSNIVKLMSGLGIAKSIQEKVLKELSTNLAALMVVEN